MDYKRKLSYFNIEILFHPLQLSQPIKEKNDIWNFHVTVNHISKLFKFKYKTRFVRLRYYSQLSIKIVYLVNRLVFSQSCSFQRKSLKTLARIGWYQLM